ncbi:hypothetical protein NL676_005073 [Syzygium grande]|nr:hypothetical protein NL676_005073 [Syzygium grande]
MPGRFFVYFFLSPKPRQGNSHVHRARTSRREENPKERNSEAVARIDWELIATKVRSLVHQPWLLSESLRDQVCASVTRSHLLFCLPSRVGNLSMADGMEVADSNEMTLETVRDSLIREEDTIIFSLIERTKYPINVGAYDKSKTAISGCSNSLVEFMVKETEAAYAKCGRYENPEEHPFFPDGLPTSLVPAFNYPKILHPAAASINVNSTIWEMYFTQLLPLITVPGDDGNYASTAVSDLACLQALSRRIHYGKFVAEVKFKDAPQEYEPAILSQDRDALMKLLTFESVEEKVKKRVAKKTMLFGQEVSLDDNYHEKKLKINPVIVSRLYEEWVMPLTKLVEVEYLLRRLD